MFGTDPQLSDVRESGNGDVGQFTLNILFEISFLNLSFDERPNYSGSGIKSKVYCNGILLPVQLVICQSLKTESVYLSLSLSLIIGIVCFVFLLNELK